MSAVPPSSRPPPDAPGPAASVSPTPEFGVNEVRLTLRQWILALGLFAIVVILTPWTWKRFERFETGADYRIPYSLSRDYWLYARRLQEVPRPASVIVLGDSVVWGEYVLPDGTLSHFLDRASGATNRFINAGVNGLFPLALEGLVRHYGGTLGRRKVILHCNLLWMSSPKADLSTDKEESFNHSRLVPQFSPRIPCYRADASERLGAWVQHQVVFLQWVDHLENAYFDQRSIPRWTLADDGGDPPVYTNTFRNPLSQITFEVPSSAGPDPDRGPTSARHRPWNRGGARLVDFEWVAAGASLQWASFQRTVQRLRDRGADLLVVVGPFNEPMLGAGNKAAYAALHGQVVAWLAEHRIPHTVPPALPAELYADASHPLTAGYELLARRLWETAGFREWLGAR